MPLVNLKLKWFWLARSNIWMLCTVSSRAASLTVCLQQEMDFVQKEVFTVKQKNYLMFQKFQCFVFFNK